jgi:hypothetical protein
MPQTTARDAPASRRITAWLVASGLALCAATAAARPADGPCQAKKQYNVPAKMRDGVTPALAAEGRRVGLRSRG